MYIAHDTTTLFLFMIITMGKIFEFFCIISIIAHLTYCFQDMSLIPPTFVSRATVMQHFVSIDSLWRTFLSLLEIPTSI